MGTQRDNPLTKFLEVPGAKTTLPVRAAKKGFSVDWSSSLRVQTAIGA